MRGNENDKLVTIFKKERHGLVSIGMSWLPLADIVIQAVS
jgi:hypothetical protein